MVQGSPRLHCQMMKLVLHNELLLDVKLKQVSPLAGEVLVALLVGGEFQKEQNAVNEFPVVPQGKGEFLMLLQRKVEFLAMPLEEEEYLRENQVVAEFPMV